MPNFNRKDMPQVNTQNLGKALDIVSDKVSITKETIPASKLKKSQKELYKDKVIGIANKYNSPNDMKPIIISKDNHIVDGHHRWGAAIHKWGDDVKLKVYKINLSAKNAIKLYKHIADMIDETIKEIMESTTLNEGGVWTIDTYFKLNSIVPDRFRNVLTRDDSVQIRNMEKDLADHLNAFWKKWKIPYKIDLNKKRYYYFPGMESVVNENVKSLYEQKDLQTQTKKIKISFDIDWNDSIGKVDEIVTLAMSPDSTGIYTIGDDIEKFTGLPIEDAKKYKETPDDAFIYGMSNAMNGGKDIYLWINGNRLGGSVKKDGLWPALFEILSHESVHLTRQILARNILKKKGIKIENGDWINEPWPSVGDDPKVNLIDEEAFATSLGLVVQQLTPHFLKMAVDYIPQLQIEGTLNEIPMGDLQKIDTFADKQLNPVDVVLTDKHFFDRLNDPRNDKEISSAELIGFFKRLSKYKKEFVDFLNQYNQIVAVDDRTNINIPFMKQANKAIAKTIMRKKDFKTPNKKLEI